jgi:hypothetical protein
VARHPATDFELTEADLSGWRLMENFRLRLATATKSSTLRATWAHAQRRLKRADYLSLYLFALLNPVVRTMRGVCAASQLARVQTEICSRSVSLGSFSEAQAVLEPELLAQVFQQLGRELLTRDGSVFGKRSWLIQDGSLFAALPRMHWALWRRQGTPQGQVRLHLSLDLGQNSPQRAAITPGKQCERSAWRTLWRRGDAYVGDRYYGEDYQLFGELDEAGVAFDVRLLDTAVVNVLEELPLTEADRKANVIRHAWVQLGCKTRYQSIRLRVVWVQTPKGVLRLVTNLGVAELSAAEVALLYKERWQIELFFRWIKCILGCRHWLAESRQGVAIQLYLALIAALLLLLYNGRLPNKRMMELIQLYFMGMASLIELSTGLAKERARTQKKS